MTSFSELVAAANGALENPQQSRVVGGTASQTPRFEVYHAPFSVCSHKVRAVLAEKAVPFTSHEMNMNLVAPDAPCPDNYKPGYVRLRLHAAPGTPLVGAYTGQSSVATQGLDPCVVPTLVDHEKERVIVDSAAICSYLDQETSGTTLVPQALTDQIAAQIDLIDQAPHVAILYGAGPNNDDRPERLAAGLTGVHARKIVHLRAVMQIVSNAPDLLAAYEAKIAKEENAKRFIHDHASMVDAHASMGSHVAALELQLSGHGGPWAMGQDYTMADIMWSVSLFRLKWIGLGRLWEEGTDAPKVADYVLRAFARPSFQNAVINWPRSTPPTIHIEESAPYAQKLLSVWRDMAVSA